MTPRCKKLAPIFSVPRQAKTSDVGTAEYLFKTALQTVAGHFKKEHGGMDLNAARCLLAMQRAPEVRDVMLEYTTDPKIVEIIEWFYECSKPLYQVGLLFKSQRKMTKDRCDKLREETALFTAHILRMCPKKNPVYHKLHQLLFHTIHFADDDGICGHARCEGMENAHCTMNALRSVLNTIPTTEIRVKKIAHRMQIFLIDEVQKRRQKIKDATKNSGARGRYNIDRKFKYQENLEDITNYDITCSLKIGKDEEDLELVEIDDGMLIPKAFHETYKFYAKNEARSSTIEVIENSTKFGTKAKKAARFMDNN